MRFAIRFGGWKATVIREDTAIRQLEIPSAARAATKYSRLVEAARCQPSAFSDQLLNKFCDFSRFTEQDFFAKRKEVTHKDSIHRIESSNWCISTVVARQKDAGISEFWPSWDHSSSSFPDSPCSPATERNRLRCRPQPHPGYSR